MTKRRVFTPEYKTQVVLEVLTGARTAAEACRERQLSAQRLNRWKAQFLEEAPCTLNNRARQSRPGGLYEVERNSPLAAHGPDWMGTIALMSARAKWAG